MSESAFDLITVGDSTIDTFIRIHDASIECDINNEECKISVPYGSKIPVDSIAYGVAGNAANVAVGTSKLGINCATYTNLGDDDQGETIKDALLNAGVADDYIIVNKGQKSNLSVVLTFQGERTIFVYHQSWHYSLPKMSACKWLYFTSLAESFTQSNIVDEVCHFVDKKAANLVFAPGTFQIKANVKRFPKLLERCQLLIVNMEEAKKILDLKMDEPYEPHDLLSKLLFLGPKMIVVTDGAEGSWGVDGHNFFKLGIVPSNVVEKTGAGDAYSSGLVAGLIKGELLSEAMVWGTINASFVVREVGTQNGLLTDGQIAEERKRLASFKAVNL